MEIYCQRPYRKSGHGFITAWGICHKSHIVQNQCRFWPWASWISKIYKGIRGRDPVTELVLLKMKISLFISPAEIIDIQRAPKYYVKKIFGWNSGLPELNPFAALHELLAIFDPVRAGGLLEICHKLIHWSSRRVRDANSGRLARFYTDDRLQLKTFRKKRRDSFESFDHVLYSVEVQDLSASRYYSIYREVVYSRWFCHANANERISDVSE